MPSSRFEEASNRPGVRKCALRKLRGMEKGLKGRVSGPGGKENREMQVCASKSAAIWVCGQVEREC